MNISIFYEKGDTSKIIKELTYNIGNVGVELKQSNDNRQDIDIAAFTYNDAKYIRKEIQINNEDVYFLYIYLSIFSKDKKELEYNLDKIEGILQSKGLQTRRSNFRQEQLFKSCLPILENNEDLRPVAKRNILTSGLISTYPFMSSSIFEEKGIYIGNNIYNNSVITKNKLQCKQRKIFKKNYIGSNICLKEIFVITNCIMILQKWQFCHRDCSLVIM